MIYKAKRVGQYGRVFTLYKLKTMIDNDGPISSGEDDARITRLGKLLRKTKLDELPQLWNWVKGDIGLIGWRPEDPKYLHTIHPEVLATKPGIIGYATVFDMDEGELLKGSKDPDKDFEDKVLPYKRANELYYVRNKNWRLDLWILKKTIGKLLLKLGGTLLR